MGVKFRHVTVMKSGGFFAYMITIYDLARYRAYEATDMGKVLLAKSVRLLVKNTKGGVNDFVGKLKSNE